MPKLGTWEIILIVVVILILFGAKRLPEVGKGVGEFFKNLKESLKGPDDKNKP